MATLDISPITNSIRSFGSGLANLALKKAALQYQNEKDAALDDLRQSQMDFNASKTALNQQKLDAVAPVLAALKGMDMNDINVRNEMISAANGKPTYAYQNIGNTGATFNKATGEVGVESNPLLSMELAQRASGIDKNNAMAAAALALKAVRDEKAKGGTSAANRTSSLKIPDLFSSYVEVDDGMGGKRTMKQVDYDRMGAMAAQALAQGLDPLDPRTYITLMGQAAVQPTVEPQGAVPAQPSVQPQNVQPDPQVQESINAALQAISGQQASLPMTREKLLELYSNGKLSRDQVEAIAAGLGFE